VAWEDSIPLLDFGRKKKKKPAVDAINDGQVSTPKRGLYQNFAARNEVFLHARVTSFFIAWGLLATIFELMYHQLGRLIVMNSHHPSVLGRCIYTLAIFIQLYIRCFVSQNAPEREKKSVH
jgi:hypothetical protein